MVRNIDRIGTCCPLFDLHTIGVKIDHNVSDKHHFSAYYNHEYRNRLNNSGGSAGRYLPIPGSVEFNLEESVHAGPHGSRVPEFHLDADHDQPRLAPASTVS